MENPSFELGENKSHAKNGETNTVTLQNTKPSGVNNSAGKIFVIVVVILLVVCAVLIALLVVEKNKTKDSVSSRRPEKKDNNTKDNGTVTDEYSYSLEAERIGLETFLEKVREAYYEYNKHELPWQDHKTYDEITKDINERYLPLNTTPEYLKEKTDAAFSLLKELKSKGVNEEKLNPRELKAVEQVKHYLKTVFGKPYDQNFYNGDWMLGPNGFCWQPICSISYSIDAHGYYVNLPTNLDEFRNILKIILLNRETILQYKLNMQLGVKAGMVRSKTSCLSGLDAFKQQFKILFKENNPSDVLKEWFVQIYKSPGLTRKLSQADQDSWIKHNKKNTTTSIDEYLVKGIGEPLVELLNYLEKDHIRNCLPQDVSDGLGNLPVDFVYLDGNATTNRTTKTLPLTNMTIDGSNHYKNILYYFTTSDKTPEEINEIGNRRLNILYPQVVDIAKEVTGEANETTAVEKFREELKQQKNYYNSAPFPANESDNAAYKNCSNAKLAEKNCPARWAAFLEWSGVARQVMGMLAPKLIPLFYHTGEKITIPNCPLTIALDFNPSAGAQSFRQSNSACTGPARFYLPFFLTNFGPRYSEWSVTAHEAWPGHHTQVQGQEEYFQDKYGGVPKWLHDETSYTFFIEGWGLYAENPVVAKDTDTYKNNIMQKYGMLKWQIWRALRLIVDTGLHYRGMTRSEALGYFSKYAWDESDIAEKEVTRYQSVPGQATAYMLGQETLIELRNYTKTQLEKKFNLQDFHYQVLSKGSAPAGYLRKHVEKYVKCMLGELSKELCEVILKVSPKSHSMKRMQRERLPRSPVMRYL